MTAPGKEAQTGTGINGPALRSLGMVLAAGAIGGLLYWVVAKLTGTPLPTAFGAAIVFVLMFVGSLAAAFGVYLLTTSDLSAIRTYVFAAVCGLAWQPVINSAQRLATNAAASNQTAQVGARVGQIRAAANGGSVQQITSAVQDTTSAVNAALNLSTSVSDTSKKTEIADSSKLAINELQSTAAKAPDASIDALKNISLAAGTSGQASVAIHAVETLHTIGDDAKRKNNLAMFQKVQKSLSAVASQSKDSSIQAAARTAASQF